MSVAPDTTPRRTQSDATRHELVVFRAGRKEPELPERGIVIVPDSLLASRPALIQTLLAWSPDGFAYDEAHRARTWKGKRSTILRDFVNALRPGALRLVATGTPMFSSPEQLVPLLALSGHLDRVFGGYSAFIERYCKRDRFNALVPNMETLPELRRILDEQVWVRRAKADVQKDLPKVSHTAVYLDVELGVYRQAHAEVFEKAYEWVDSWAKGWAADPSKYPDEYPDIDAIQSWAASNISVISPLRRAAAMAKVPHLLETAHEWVRSQVDLNADGSFVCRRPLLVWVHHKDAMTALVEGIPAAFGDRVQGLVSVIQGSTSTTDRGRIVDEFQAGRVPVLVCSIQAAGVGITLTRGSDQIFLETDWDPPPVQQAIDRQNRIGQTQPVSVRTLVAEGTLDAHIHKVLQRKAAVLELALGDKVAAGVSRVDLDSMQTQAKPSVVLAAIALSAVERHHSTKGGHRAA